jgi:hypothetical protein
MGNIFSPKMVETSSGAHSVSFTVGFGVRILSLKQGLVFTTNCAPSAEFENEWSCTSALCTYLRGEYRSIFFTSLPRFLWNVRTNQTHQDRSEESDILGICFGMKLDVCRLIFFNKQFIFTTEKFKNHYSRRVDRLKFIFAIRMTLIRASLVTV